jgi:hypothetical protein
MANEGVKGLAVSVTEQPDQLRRKIEFLRQRSVGGIWQTKDVTDDYTPVAGDFGSLILFASATGKTITLSATLPEGWWCGLAQILAGQAIFVPGTGATVNSRAATDRTLDQYSRVWLEVVANSDGQSASYLVSGDVG